MLELATAFGIAGRLAHAVASSVGGGASPSLAIVASRIDFGRFARRFMRLAWFDAPPSLSEESCLEWTFVLRQHCAGQLICLASADCEKRLGVHFCGVGRGS